MNDIAGFEICLDGPDVSFGSGCSCFDLVDDGYVDLQDFAAFQSNFNGS